MTDFTEGPYEKRWTTRLWMTHGVARMEFHPLIIGLGFQFRLGSYGEWKVEVEFLWVTVSAGIEVYTDTEF